MNGGTLRNAVLSASGGAQMVFGNGTLDGVTVNGDLDVGRQNSAARMTVLNGLVLNGTLYVGNPTNRWYGAVTFSGTQTLSGNGTVVFGNYGVCNALRLASGGTSLTIGPEVTVRGHSGAIGHSTCWGGPLNVAVINQGTITAELSGGTISISAQRFTNQANVQVSNGASLNIDTLDNTPSGTVLVNDSTLTLSGSWTNAGSMSATNSTVNLNGSFNLASLGVFNRSGGTVNLGGTLDNGGAVIALNAGTGSWVMSGGTLRNAVLTVSGGAQLTFGNGTLDGVTVNGDLDVGRQNNAASLTVLNNLALNGTLYVGHPTNRWYGAVNFSGTQTLSGNGSVVFGNQGVCNALRLASSGTSLTIGPGVTVRGHSGAIGHSTCWGGPLNVAVINQGTVTADVSGGTISFNGQTVVNQGTIATAAAGGTIVFNTDLELEPSSVLSVALGGPQAGLGYGQVNVSGNLAFDGMFKVALTNGFAPNAGDTFTLLNYGSRSQGFRQTAGLGLSGDPFLQVISGDRSLALITKSVLGNPPGPPTNLVNQVVVAGGTALFHIDPLGQEPFSYQWRFNGSAIIGATNSALTLTNVLPAQAGLYSVVVADGLGGVTTYSATLSVLTAPVITIQPLSVVVAPGSGVTLSVAGSGDGPLQYQWRLNGASIPGATSTTFSIPNAQPVSGGSYSVSVANAVGAVSSANATVVVTSPALTLADNFEDRQSISSMAGVGSGTNTNATKEVGEPSHADKVGGKSVWLTWMAPTNGVATFSTRGSSFDTVLAAYVGDVSTNLAVAAGDDDGGDFFTSEVTFEARAGTNYNIAIDGSGGASGNIVLSWSLDTRPSALPLIVSQPLSQTVTPGAEATLTVVATSSEPLRYQWLFNEYSAIPGATNATWHLTNVQASSAGRYLVEVSNSSGQRIRSVAADVEVGENPKDRSEDKFTDLFDHVGTSGIQLAGAGRRKFKPRFPSVSAGSVGTQNLNNFNATTEQGEPQHGGVIGGSSRWFILTAVENATLMIDTTGSDFDTVLAVYTGTNLFGLHPVASDNNGAPDAVRSRVRFRTVAGTDYLIAVDGVRGAQGNIVLNWRMGTPPVLVSSPANQTVAIHGTVSFSAAASGKPAPNYQWQFNGRNIAGATNPVLVLTNVVPAQAGSYRVMADNLIDAVTSVAALLTVAQTPLMVRSGSAGITNGQFRMVIEGGGTDAVVIEAASNLAVGSSWTPVWTNPPNAGAMEYVDPTAGEHPLRFYRAKAAAP